jgi:hypothetical protein
MHRQVAAVPAAIRNRAAMRAGVGSLTVVAENKNRRRPCGGARLDAP